VIAENTCYQELPEPYRSMPPEELSRILNAFEADVQNNVYQAAVQLFEFLEHRGLITGNGHHMAQDVAAYAAELLSSRWVKR
jgi:hypothetical protein